MTEKNVFRDQLYNHTLPVSEGLWDTIEAQLPPEHIQKRFPVFWLTLFGTTLLGGALMIGVFTKNANTTPAPLATKAVIASSLNPNLESTDSAVRGHSIEVSNDADMAVTAITESTTSSAKSTGFVNTNDANDKFSSSQSPNHKSSNQKSQNRNSLNQNSLNHNSLNEEEALLPNSEDLPNTILIDQTAASDLPNNNSGISLLAYRNTTSTEFLPLTELNQSSSGLSLMTGIAPDPNCYKFGDIGAHYAFSLDFLGGVGFSPKTYEQNGGETADYITARNETEKNQYAWSLGARLNLHHRSGLTGRLGFQYTQVGDIFDYTDSLATQTTTRIDSFFAADGTFLYTEVTQVLIDGTLVKKIHNTYRYLDIPLLIGYELRMGRNIIMLHAGPVFNLTSSHRGQILDSMFHPRSITPGTPGAIDVYKTNVGLSVYFGAGILFPISDRLSALVEPSYLYRIKPVTLNSYELRETRHFASLNLGIRYHIN